MWQKVSRTPADLAKELLDEIVDPAEYEAFRNVEFGYENLVMEGGGNKGIGYAGMIKVLDDLGMLKNIKRFAGASMGAVVAAKLALGGSSYELFEDLLIDLSKLSEDGHAIDIIRSLLRKFGWHPGKKLLKHFRAECLKYTGNPDITFRELYDLNGKELCLTVTNLSSCCVEYFHPKTTPDVPIAQAIRMSVSIPVLFRPVLVHNGTDKSYMVDGGLMNNYPLNAFDGWFLDMDPRHSFFHMIDSREPFFGKSNPRTLGAVVYDAFESELNEEVYIGREGYETPVRPDTNLVRRKMKRVEKLLADKVQRGKLITASKTFLSILSASDLDRNGSISLDEFILAMKKCPKDVLEVLFLSDCLTEQLFKEIDKDKDGEITYDEFISYLQQKGLPLRHHMMASTSRDIRNLADYLAAIFDSRDLLIRSLMAKDEDANRTIGIYTDYIGVTDFKLETKDKIFGAKQGWKATIAFLKERTQILAGRGEEVLKRKRESRKERMPSVWMSLTVNSQFTG